MIIKCYKLSKKKKYPAWSSAPSSPTPRALLMGLHSSQKARWPMDMVPARSWADG